MTKVFNWLHKRECSIFHWINGKWQYRILSMYFKSISNLGGATFSISICILLLLVSSEGLKTAAIQSLFALFISHVPVQISKKTYPRKRPYQVFPNTVTISRLLEDHSFPSGHTTAIFAVTTPLILWNPLLGIALLPLSFSVALSRIYLGLHYPSDVITGMLLGICSAILLQQLPI
ncbi:phosphatase PAP2 family protein [Pseudalkalibacillus decolorationis]|uniref:phosphatase PAP2 family protein n=1 Tax=Pseudalkalibacillus decolorationis TaxID=163879 RepID=UPI0021480DE0|nr:phosphatase PAP2 family protein [Pseudalkalibacillus decolorationis]